MTARPSPTPDIAAIEHRLSGLTRDYVERLDRLAAISRYRRPPGECAFCDAHRGEMTMPPHTPSKNCESGKRPHCTCDRCF